VSRRRTRIETRTLALFVACALVPVVAFALFGSLIVDRQLRAFTDEQIEAAAKSYGLAIYDRLTNVDRQLTVLTERYLAGEIQPAGIEGFSDGRARIRVLDTVRAGSATSGMERRLKVSNQAEPTVFLEIQARNADRALHVIATFSGDYLWNTDAVLVSDAVLCVRNNFGARLHCSASETQGGLDSKTLVAGEWTLFLNGTYGSHPWTIDVRAPRASGAIAWFRWVFPVIAALAVAVALLAGSIFIRRSHEPLRMLIDAARRIGRRRAGQALRVTSRDEYGRLARSFNRMASRLDDQFDLLTLLAQLDRTILERSGTKPAMQELILKLPQLLKCRIAAIVLPENDVELHLVRRGSSTLERVALPMDAMAEFEGGDASLRRFACNEHSPGVLAEFSRRGVDAAIAQTIRVGGKVRAILLISDELAKSSFVARRLHDVAHRLAVAFANEDHEKALWRQAYSDSLTGLANRAMLREWLASNILRNGDRIAEGAIVFVDLDRFKSVNDSLGHSMGDSLLQQVAGRLQQQLPVTALLARFGGDEFVIVLPQTSRAGARETTRAMLDSLREPCELEHIHYVAQASAGIAMFPTDGTTVDELLQHADIALYRAKADGRGQLCFFDESMSRMAKDRLLLEDQLRNAIRDGEIVAHYQPKVDRDGIVVGVEALARWLPSGGEAVSPARFVPLAEETGLIVPMGDMLLREVCRSIRGWRQRGLHVGRVAVNISMVQMRDAGFAEALLQCLAEHDLRGQDLEIELTESVFAEDRNAIAAQLFRLQDAGVHIAIDDFGTGFSSMSLLRHFPIHALKIDRSFVIDLVSSEESRLLLHGLIEIGHAMKLEVVSEGVETDAQFQLLRELRCDVFQGYLFSKALTARELEAFLEVQSTGLRAAS
jgi:diguanylate cyclase (GGDEF)-like protein